MNTKRRWKQEKWLKKENREKGKEMKSPLYQLQKFLNWKYKKKKKWKW